MNRECEQLTSLHVLPKFTVIRPILSLVLTSLPSLALYLCIFGTLAHAAILVGLQEIPSGSIYRNSSKNRAKLSLVLGHFFSSAIMNDLFKTFTFRLKVDAK